MPRALSIDLALKSYDDFGLCLLDSESGTAAAAEFPSPSAAGLKGRPDPEPCAEALADYCHGRGVSVLLMDGPQAWKDPSTRHEHSRICEALLKTPGKMGLPGTAKPGPFLPFARFCVELFAALGRHGGVLPHFEPFEPPEAGFLLLETFPTAAWKALGLAPLVAKSRAKRDDPAQASQDLQRLYPVSFRHSVSHDEAQALVSGMAGVAVATGNHAGYEALGGPLREVDGVLREGYIVVPTRDCMGRENRPAERLVVPPGPGRKPR